MDPVLGGAETHLAELVQLCKYKRLEDSPGVKGKFFSHGSIFFSPKRKKIFNLVANALGLAHAAEDVAGTWQDALDADLKN